LRILLSIFVGILISIPSVAQTSSGRIVGTVLDPSGASVKGAIVSILNERTNRERSTTTNDAGSYAFTSLDPSDYTLTASQPGFAKAEVKGLPLQVGQEIRPKFGSDG
jgi:hypothetical protein